MAILARSGNPTHVLEIDVLQLLLFVEAGSDGIDGNLHPVFQA